MQRPLLSWIYLIVLALIWGSSFILMKKGMVAFTAMEVGALRIVLASAFLLPFLLKHHKIDFKKYGFGLLGMGMFGNLIPSFLFTTAETQISSSLAGMLNALTPVFTIILSVFFFRQKTNTFQVMGIVCGFGGAVLLMLAVQGDEKQSNNILLYSMLVVAATLCYALSVNIIKMKLGDLNSITASVWAFTFIGPFALVYLIYCGFFNRWASMDKEVFFYSETIMIKAKYFSLLHIAVLGIVGSSISVIMFNTLIKNAGTVFASSVTYLIPVVAIFWGLAAYEPIYWPQYLGMGVVLAAIWLINRRKN